MRFTKPFWDGIADGSITVAFRRWAAPTVVAGRPYRTGGGRIEVVSVAVVDADAITEVDAERAGYANAGAVRDSLRDDRIGPGWQLYRIEFQRLIEPDPREVLAASQRLTSDDVAHVSARLDRLDRASTFGPWTRPTLRLIRVHPGVRAPDLAAWFARDTQPFKLDVRKLKNMGLTHSLKVGYRLSPRGEAYLNAIDDAIDSAIGDTVTGDH